MPKDGFSPALRGDKCCCLQICIGVRLVKYFLLSKAEWNPVRKVFQGRERLAVRLHQGNHVKVVFCCRWGSVWLPAPWSFSARVTQAPGYYFWLLLQPCDFLKLL